MRRFASLVAAITLILSNNGHVTSAQGRTVTICHKPGTPAQKTLTIPEEAVQGHLVHGDRLGSCEEGGACTAPPAIPPDTGSGTDPVDEAEYTSGTVATLEGASETGFTAPGAPITLHLSCPTLKIGPDSVIVYDNGRPVPYSSLALAADSVTLTYGVGSGRHTLRLLAQDIYDYTIDAQFVVWAGDNSMPVLVLDEKGAPASGVPVTAKLSDDPDVTATVMTNGTGQAVFTNLPNRSYNIIALASGNRFATQPASVYDGWVVLRLRGFNAASPIDNNDFTLGTAGWDIGTAPVSVVTHVEGSPSGGLMMTAAAAEPSRTPEASVSASSHLHGQGFVAAVATAAGEAPDFDLVLNTSGQGQQSISRTFDVEAGYESVTVRFRFITSEVPGGWFGSQFNDFFNVTVRSVQGGGLASDGNSMNGLGLAAFDGGGATGWYEAELPVRAEGDTVQVDVAVANVADGLFDSQVVVDAVKKKKLTISQLQLNDIDNTGLQYLSASAHTYFSGTTRVHGTITVKGPKDDKLTELTLEIYEGGKIATGKLDAGVTSTLLTQFGDAGQVQLSTSKLLFNVPGSELAGANQSANGQLTLRVKAKSSSGETAEKDFGPVTKLVHFTGTNRYGERDGAVGGDDWAKPTVKTFIDGAGLTWGDFSNMNGGPFSPHSSHRTGNSADGWFSGYNARDAETAATIIGHINTHGTRIQIVYVTFAPDSAFAKAIKDVKLDDGRLATDVIRNFAGHTTHFHWEVSE